MNAFSLAPCLGLALLLASCSSEAATTPDPDAPDVAVREILTRLAAKDSTVLFDAAPASYIQDSAKVVELAHKHLNKDLYDAGANIVIKLTRILKEKKEYVLEYPMLKMILAPEKLAELKQGYDGMVGVFTAMTESNLKSHESLQRFSLQSFLKKTGNQILAISAKAGGKAVTTPLPLPDPNSVKLIERKEDKAIIGWTNVDGTHKKEFFQKIEGKWIPVSLDKQWRDGIAQLQQNIEQMGSTKSEASIAQQSAMTTQLKDITAQLDLLLAADTKMKFNMLLGKAMQPLMGPMMKAIMGASRGR